MSETWRQREIEALRGQLEVAERERDKWKISHDGQVAAKRRLSKEVGRLIRERDEMTIRLSKMEARAETAEREVAAEEQSHADRPAWMDMPRTIPKDGRGRRGE